MAARHRDPLLALVLLASSGCAPGGPARVEAPPDSASGTIGFDWAGPNQAALVVPVHLNGGGPYSFVLDTGATLTCIDAELSRELDLPEPTGAIGIGAGVGGGGQMRLVRIDSLRVGTARVEGLPACAIDLGNVEQLGIELDGLLGLNFLRSFRVSIDFDRGLLTLQEP